MFAGAAREAVFSNAEVIRRINTDFVPVALKAALVNNPPSDVEGRLYREIARSRPAPQGICVANSDGKVLSWALSFDDEKSILAFLNYNLKRYAQYPDARQPLTAERYMRFPSNKLPDVADEGNTVLIVPRHAQGEYCPAKPPFERGTLAARVYGRALDENGKPVADTVRQEHYVEDRFEVPVQAQERLASALANAGNSRFRVPDELARLFVSHAYLGQLDVDPFRGGGDLSRVEFWGQRIGNEQGTPTHIRVEGQSEVEGGQSHSGTRSDGRLWHHQVKLDWDGMIEVQENRMTRLLLLANGSERLTWGNAFQKLDADRVVAQLPAGRPIDLDSGVRYGIIGEPVPEEEAAAVIPSTPAQVPDIRQHLVGMLGPQFVVFFDAVQDDLKMSTVQKRELERAMTALAQSFHMLMQEPPSPQREPRFHQFRQTANERLRSVLADTLTSDQQERLQQIILQQEGLFALGAPDVSAELKLSDAQRMQFAAVMQETQQRFAELQQRAASTGNPQAVQQQAMKIRKEQEAKIEALLTDAQKQQWRAMLGEPLALGFDGRD